MRPAPPPRPPGRGGYRDGVPAPAEPDAVVPVPTRHGPATAAVHRAARAGRPVGTVVLGHGAGGGVGAPDLVTATRAARDAGWQVVLVEQPYRVAGRRVPPRPPLIDAAWTDVLDHLRGEVLGDAPLVVGGRSSGARVACRTAAGTGAVGALCLAFPLQPPQRSGREAASSRLAELEAAGVPVLVVQGDRDPFGVPPAGPDRRVVVLGGDHALRRDHDALHDAVVGWLGGLTGP